MPLDKMPDSSEFALTHNCRVLHVKGNPVPCIVDESQNLPPYDSISEDPILQASLRGFLNKHEELGLLMGAQLQIKTGTEFVSYTIYPDEEFVDAVILVESIFVIDTQLNTLFVLKKITTDQFVKTKSEFGKFKEMTR